MLGYATNVKHMQTCSTSLSFSQCWLPYSPLAWATDIIGKKQKERGGYEYVLVVIDYFTKLVKIASYAITSKHVVKFIVNNIIYRNPPS